jgi:MoaA/NifB/PqqE/SkfB family radical SAM enzyme
MTRLEQLPRYRNTAIKSLWSRVRFFLHVLACRVSGARKPLFVVLVTNNTCNLSCTYCYGQYGERRQYRDYTTEELVGIIDALWALGTRNVTIHGGESLLRRDIGQILNYLKWKGFYVSLNTNGTLVPRKIDDIRCVDTVCISLDGAEESHDRNRGKGSYRDAMAAIEIIRKHAIPLVIHATLTKQNVKDMDFLAQKSVELGFRLQYSILYKSGRMDDSDVLSDREIRDVMGKIGDLKRQGYPVYYSAQVLTAVQQWPLALEDKPFASSGDVRQGGSLDWKGQIPCYHGRLKFQIDADGRVVTCWGHDDEDAPNIKNIGVENAIKQCADRKDCQYCTFLANNEHNLMFDLDLKALADLVVLQLSDSLKIKK